MKYNLNKAIAALVLAGIGYTAMAQTEGVSIKSTVSPPHPSAMLDIESTSKGLLVPRVTLTGTADATTIANPATSLLVYNTATAGTSPNNVTPGYYYNSGTAAAPIWKLMGGSNSLWSLHSNGTDIFRSNGKVGIGTTSPLSLLQIGQGYSIVSIGQTGWEGGGTGTFIGFNSEVNFGDAFNKIGQLPGAAAFVLNNVTGDLMLQTRSFATGETAVAFSPKYIFKAKDNNGNDIALLRLSDNRQNGRFIEVGNDGNEINCGAGGLCINYNNGEDVALGQYWQTITTQNQVNLLVGGNVDAKYDLYARGQYIASDSILKKNIKTISNSLFEVKKLRPVEYDLKDSPEKGKQFGLIAQEVEKIYPELVITREQQKNFKDSTAKSNPPTKAVNYIGLIPHLIEAMQEQQALIEQLQQQNAILTNRLEALEKKKGQ